MKNLFNGFKKGIILTYKMFDSKVPMWVCWTLGLITVPINLVIMFITYLITGNAVPKYLVEVEEEFRD